MDLQVQYNPCAAGVFFPVRGVLLCLDDPSQVTLGNSATWAFCRHRPWATAAGWWAWGCEGAAGLIFSLLPLEAVICR